MKKLLFVLLFGIGFSHAQTDSLKTKKPIKFMVDVTLGPKTQYSGVLCNIEDTSLTIQQLVHRNRQRKIQYKTYQTGLIKTVRVQRRHSELRGLIIGASIGLISGAMIGFAGGDDPTYAYPNVNEDPYGVATIGVSLANAFAFTAGQKALLAGTTGLVFGSLVGVLIGAVAKKKFIINGSKEKFQEMKMSLLDMAYKQPVKSK